MRKSKEIIARLERVEKALQTLTEAVNKRYISDRTNDSDVPIQSILNEYLYGEDPSKRRKE